MTKSEFLAVLANSLKGLPDEERTDILYDYEEHFANGIAAGKTEEEIAASLGDPAVVAKHYRADYIVKKAEEKHSVGNILRAVVAVVSLGFFNLVFVLGPFLALVGILFGLFAAAVGIILGGIGGFFGSLFSNSIPAISIAGMSSDNALFGIFASIGVTAFGLLFLIADIYLAKFFYRGVVSYLRMNARIITK